jgi:Fe-S cluster biogenesis protein NfuA
VSALRMHTERTPNPASVKWVLGRALVPEAPAVSFDSDPGGEVSPLAARILAVSGVRELLIGSDFVTVTKDESAGWRELGLAVGDAIRRWDAAGEPVLGPRFARPGPAPDDEVVRRIRRILDEEIAPSVAQDGGEISLASFEDGVVRLVLRGACHSCPSSNVTLKLVVETRLRAQVPEVRSVEAVEA